MVALRNSDKHRARQARNQLTAIKRAAEKLLEPDVLENLIRRGEHVVADGLQSAGGEGVSGSPQSTATERAALRLASPSEEEAAERGQEVKPDTWQEREPDPAADALNELLSNIAHAALLMGDADGCRKYVLSIESRERGRQSTVDSCQLCGAVVTNVGEDRLRSGYCCGCYSAWKRIGGPQDPIERRRFERERLDWLVEKGRTCEHLCCPITAPHDHWKAPSECPDCAQKRAC